jgi:hypothetical protein
VQGSVGSGDDPHRRQAAQRAQAARLLANQSLNHDPNIRVQGSGLRRGARHSGATILGQEQQLDLQFHRQEAQRSSLPQIWHRGRGHLLFDGGHQPAHQTEGRGILAADQRSPG